MKSKVNDVYRLRCSKPTAQEQLLTKSSVCRIECSYGPCSITSHERRKLQLDSAMMMKCKVAIEQTDVISARGVMDLHEYSETNLLMTNPAFILHFYSCPMLSSMKMPIPPVSSNMRFLFHRFDDADRHTHLRPHLAIPLQIPLLPLI